MSRWFRVYSDLVDDAKVQRLPPDAFKALVNLWCLAAQNDGAIPDVATVAFKLRVTEQKAAVTVAALKNADLLDDIDGVTKPHNWDGRQFKGDVSNERVRRHRERKRNVTEAVTATPPEVTDTEAEKIEPPSEVPANKPDDVIEALEIYHAFAERTHWPRVQRFTSQRKAACRARLKECGGLDGWMQALAKGAEASFLCGGGKDGWIADFDFFCQAKSFTKLIEGSYDDRTPGSSTGNGNRPHDAIFGALAEVVAERGRVDFGQAGSDERVQDFSGPAPPVDDPNQPPDIPAILRRTAH